MTSVTHDDERFDVGAAQARTLVLEPGRAERQYWRDLWAYRELFMILAWRDVAVRYKLGRHTPFSHHGDLHHVFGRLRFSNWAPVPGLGMTKAAPKSGRSQSTILFNVSPCRA